MHDLPSSLAPASTASPTTETATTKLPLPPGLAELPAPPKGRHGWPWTEQTTLPSDDEELLRTHAWPRISVITPAWNDAHFLEEALRSVLLGRYPNLEFVVLDGDSTDESVEVIRRYEPWLSDWVSVARRNEPEAINRGLHQASGEILTWLPARDCLLPGALYRVAEALGKDRGPELLVAAPQRLDAGGTPLHEWPEPCLSVTKNLTVNVPRLGATVFARASLFERLGPLAESLPHTYTAEWTLRALARGVDLASTPSNEAPLSGYRFVGEGRTPQAWWRIHLEFARIYLRLAGISVTGGGGGAGAAFRVWPTLKRAHRHAVVATLLASDECYAHGERRNAWLTACLATILAANPFHHGATARLRRAMSWRRRD